MLQEATKKSKKPMTLDRLEVIIDRLEHAARGGNLELDTALKLSFGRNREGPEVSIHWVCSLDVRIADRRLLCIWTKSQQ